MNRIGGSLKEMCLIERYLWLIERNFWLTDINL